MKWFKKQGIYWLIGIVAVALYFNYTSTLNAARQSLEGWKSYIMATAEEEGNWAGDSADKLISDPSRLKMHALYQMRKGGKYPKWIIDRI